MNLLIYLNHSILVTNNVIDYIANSWITHQSWRAEIFFTSIFPHLKSSKNNTICSRLNEYNGKKIELYILIEEINSILEKIWKEISINGDSQKLWKSLRFIMEKIEELTNIFLSISKTNLGSYINKIEIKRAIEDFKITEFELFQIIQWTIYIFMEEWLKIHKMNLIEANEEIKKIEAENNNIELILQSKRLNEYIKNISNITN